VLLVWVFFGYSLIFFRQPRDAGETLVDGPPIEGNPRVQVTWLAVTSALVLGLAVFGTIDLLASNAAGAGGGEGPTPLSKPAHSSTALQVQVIGQQWMWTFRYPAYGGVQTADLVIPVNREVAFHVTSLDVSHSFWAYELGVKADAIPGNDNVAFVKALHTRRFQIRCAELCGLWHGHMNTNGRVVSQAEFSRWIALQQQTYSGVTKQLPPVARHYYPVPLRRAS
jgi:cytochrome c oxidase subunit 2